MIKLFLLYLIYVNLAFADSPRKIGVLIGGGKGEGDPLTSAFFHQAEAFVMSLKDKNYEIRGAFGAPWLLEILKDGEKLKNESGKLDSIIPATVDSVDVQLNWILNEIKLGKIKKDDQIVIQLSTHGNPKDLNELAHKISIPQSLNNKNIISYSLSMKMDQVLEKLNEVGAKTAILDFSCYSGESLDLALNRPNVCVISSTNRYTPATSSSLIGGKDASTYFWQVEAKNPSSKDLESIFLTARMANNNISNESDIPEISSDENLRIRKMWDLIFITYSASKILEDRQKYVQPILNCSEVETSIPLPDYDKFENLMIEILKSDNDIINLQEISGKIKKITKIIDDVYWYMAKDLGSVESIEENGNTTFKSINFGSCSAFFNDDGSVKQLSNQSVVYALYKACTTEENLSFIAPKISENRKNLAKYIKLNNELKELGKKFAKIERNLYEKLYLDFKKDSKKSNACRDFYL